MPRLIVILTVALFFAVVTLLVAVRRPLGQPCCAFFYHEIWMSGRTEVAIYPSSELPTLLEGGNCRLYVGHDRRLYLCADGRQLTLYGRSRRMPKWVYASR